MNDFLDGSPRLTWSEFRDALICELARIENQKKRFPVCEAALTLVELGLRNMLREVERNVSGGVH